MKKLSELTTDEIIRLYHFNKYLKEEAVNKQNFELAANHRDKEKLILGTFKKIIDGIDFYA